MSTQFDSFLGSKKIFPKEPLSFSRAVDWRVHNSALAQIYASKENPRFRF